MRDVVHRAVAVAVGAHAPGHLREDRLHPLLVEPGQLVPRPLLRVAGLTLADPVLFRRLAVAHLAVPPADLLVSNRLIGDGTDPTASADLLLSGRRSPDSLSR